MELQAQLLCRQLAFFPGLRRASILGLPHERDAGKLRNGFLEYLQPFASQLRGNVGQACDVATGPRQAVSQLNKNNRNRLGRVLGCYGCRCRAREQHVDVETYELIHQGRKPVQLVIGGAILEGKVLPFDKSEFSEPAQEYVSEPRPAISRSAFEPANLINL